MLHRLKIFALTAALLIQPQYALAQNDNIERRVNKLEKEVKAVQRKVFPGGSDGFFEPEISPEQANPVNRQNQNRENAAVGDLLGRVTALEEQLASMTGQIEQQQFKMRAVETKLAELDAALQNQQSNDNASVASNAVADDTGANDAVATKPAQSSASSERRDAVAAIEVPSTGDAFDDSYSYGFRLWDKKFYPEAQIQLRETVDNFPNNARASFARNLLGRAWLDDNKPTNAAKIFYDNYKNDPRGGRAADSLYYLGIALANMSEFSKACEAYDELENAYPETAAGRLSARLSDGRAASKCS